MIYWYAIQYGKRYEDIRYGFTNKQLAIQKAHEMVRDIRFDGEEIRIAVCDATDGFILRNIIIREGNNA